MSYIKKSLTNGLTATLAAAAVAASVSVGYDEAGKIHINY
jgi:hypothetical protein